MKKQNTFKKLLDSFKKKQIKESRDYNTLISDFKDKIAAK